MNLVILVLAHVVALTVICWVTHAGPATAVGVALTGGFSVLAYVLGRSDEAEAAAQAPRRRAGGTGRPIGGGPGERQSYS